MPSESGVPTTVRLRPMHPDDIPAVVEVERRAFDKGWAATAFERELTQNRMARYLVLEADGEVTGFGGLWLMVDEAHVVTVAVRPEHRRHGMGRLIVHGLMQVARGEGMLAATLECRLSNVAARALYRNYGFYEVGVRRKYYEDNQEDAVIMTTEEFGSEPYRHRLQQLWDDLTTLLPGAEIALPGYGDAATDGN